MTNGLIGHYDQGLRKAGSGRIDDWKAYPSTRYRELPQMLVRLTERGRILERRLELHTGTVRGP